MSGEQQIQLNGSEIFLSRFIVWQSISNDFLYGLPGYILIFILYYSLTHILHFRYVLVVLKFPINTKITWKKSHVP